MPGFNKADYTAAYNKSNYHSYTVRFNIKNEGDIIRWIGAKGGMKEYITSLIRKDIREHKRKDPLQITGRKASGSDHDNIRMYPFEVLELVSSGGAGHVAYAITMDDAVLHILRHCDQGTPAGEMVIAKRDVVRHDLKYIKKGTVYAKK